MGLFGRRDGYDPNARYSPTYTHRGSGAGAPTYRISPRSGDTEPEESALRAAAEFLGLTDTSTHTRSDPDANGLTPSDFRVLSPHDMPFPATGPVTLASFPSPRAYARWYEATYLATRIDDRPPAPQAPLDESRYGHTPAGVHSDSWVEHDPARTNRALALVVGGAVLVLLGLVAVAMFAVYQL